MTIEYLFVFLTLSYLFTFISKFKLSSSLLTSKIASTSTPFTIRLSKAIEEFLYNDPKAIKAYICYANFRKVHTEKFAIFSDFPSNELNVHFKENEIISLIDDSQNDFVYYPILVKMFYANLNHGFYDGNEVEVWSSVKGT